ncbi:NAD(P)/FAD-dependent oxidoreductase [Longimicrobium sp.]|uniref:NAD(P)/FAD-dependent oxidoreductase n=1 Tax=Longimicrobium sp. TaxID=2029185 RepID=UPI002C948982|nr:FAD-dependent oxidoreductase [Longimicrobium sp.]HSU14193.1 FAD-dependent oxidoreductase [Longimicrobium sp.]
MDAHPPELARAHAPHPMPVRVVGDRWSARTHEVKDFLARSRVPYQWSDPAVSADARAILAQVPEEERARLPLLVFPDGSRLADPSPEALAEKVGLRTEPAAPFYDLVIAGSGPAGLAAAVYGASEGLRTVIVEREAPGGQAAQSARIENYLGFPDGLTGAELTERAMRQARKFGVEIVVTRAAAGLHVDGDYRTVRLDDGAELGAHAVLVATGVAWRTIDAPGCGEFIGRGVYYGAAAAEAAAVRGRDVYMLGAGNSAGQAALLLARYARSVTMLALEEDFGERMSQYLLDRIRAAPNIALRPCCTIAAAEGDGRLRRITMQRVETGDTEQVACEALFVFIGAAPETDWLGDGVMRDDAGYLLTGDAVRPRWPLERAPLPRETSCPGVFAAGDVRAGAVKRVGSAVGDGSVAVTSIHEYLAER